MNECMYVCILYEPAAFEAIKMQQCFLNISVQTVQTAAVFLKGHILFRSAALCCLSVCLCCLSVCLFAVCTALPSVYYADPNVGWLAIVSLQILYNVLL
jgi:hypothetical protein